MNAMSSIGYTPSSALFDVRVSILSSEDARRAARVFAAMAAAFDTDVLDTPDVPDSVVSPAPAVVLPVERATRKPRVSASTKNDDILAGYNAIAGALGVAPVADQATSPQPEPEPAPLVATIVSENLIEQFQADVAAGAALPPVVEPAANRDEMLQAIRDAAGEKGAIWFRQNVLEPSGFTKLSEFNDAALRAALAAIQVAA